MSGKNQNNEFGAAEGGKVPGKEKGKFPVKPVVIGVGAVALGVIGWKVYKAVSAKDETAAE